MHECLVPRMLSPSVSRMHWYSTGSFKFREHQARRLWLQRGSQSEELGVELLKWFKKNDTHEKCQVSRCSKMCIQNSFRYSEVLIQMENKQRISIPTKSKTLFCTQGTKLLEEYQLEAITQYPEYLHEVLGARVRIISTDTFIVLQTTLCVEFTTWFDYHAYDSFCGFNRGFNLTVFG